MHEPQAFAYKREFLPDKRIKSTCLKCGLEIIGNVSQGHAQAELDHEQRCHAAAASA